MVSGPLPIVMDIPIFHEAGGPKCDTVVAFTKPRQSSAPVCTCQNNHTMDTYSLFIEYIFRKNRHSNPNFTPKKVPKFLYEHNGNNGFGDSPADPPHGVAMPPPSDSPSTRAGRRMALLWQANSLKLLRLLLLLLLPTILPLVLLPLLLSLL